MEITTNHRTYPLIQFYQLFFHSHEIYHNLSFDYHPLGFAQELAGEFSYKILLDNLFKLN